MRAIGITLAAAAMLLLGCTGGPAAPSGTPTMLATTAPTPTAMERPTTAATPTAQATVPANPNAPEATEQPSATTLSGGAAITLQELSKHSTEQDCWVVSQGKVYDLTAWLPKHPGGAGAISPYCGNAGFEEAFNGKHGEAKVELLKQESALVGDYAG
ncbi:MAG: cytochrome b5-like heme/steroid binding domain-containing protein [Candidatus Micrarchaeota archaeon]